MTTRFTTAVFAGGIALSLVACADDTPPPTDAEYQQIAQSIGATTASGDGAAISVAADLATGTLPFGISLDGAGRFRGDHLGLQYDYAVRCLDADGDVIGCNPASDRAFVDATWSGSLELPRLYVAATRTGAWSMVGLQGATTIVDGSARFDLSSDFASASEQNRKSFELGYDATYQGVVVDNETRTMIGGSIDYDITAVATHTTPGLDEERRFDLDATVRFAGDGRASVVLDGDHTYTLDLRTGIVIEVNGE